MSGDAPIDRRAFLRSAVGVAAAGAVLGPGRALSHVADRAERSRLGTIGLQLYTVRALMDRDVEGTVAAVAAIGYREVELAGLHGKTAAQMRAILDRHRLACPSSHISMQGVRGNWSRTLDDAAALGQTYIVCPWIDEPDRTVDGYARVAHELTRAGEASHARGIQLAYHNHDYEFVPIAGRLPYDILLAESDPRLVQVELDIFWIVKGGQDPLAYFRRYPGRFPLLHAKDIARDGTMVDVGQGTIDWAAIFEHGKAAGVRHTFVEHDEPRAPIADARASFEYLRRLRF